MKTASPTRMGSESASFATRASGGTEETWMREMSARGSEAITRAGTGFSPRNSTMMSSIVWTTCAAVATLPSAEISTPEPISLKRAIPSAVTSWPRDRMTTTDGLTRRYASPRVSPLTRAGTATRSASAASATDRRFHITTPPRRHPPGSFWPAVQQVQRVHQRRHLRVRPEPLLVDRHDRPRSIERGQRAVDLRLERVVPAPHHERVRLVRDDLAAQPKLRAIPGGRQEACEQEVVRGVGVEPPLLETLQSILVIGDVDDLGFDGRGVQRGRQGPFGGRVGDEPHALAVQILHSLDPGRYGRQNTRAVDEDHVAERRLLHAAEGDRGRSAFEIDRPLHELAHPVGGRLRNPVDLEIGKLQRLPGGGGHLQAEVYRVPRRLTVGVEEGERPRRLAVAERDG